MPFPPSYYQMFLFDDRFHRYKNLLRLYFVEASLNGNGNQIIFSWLNAIIYRCGVKTIHAIAWQEVVCGREVPFSIPIDECEVLGVVIFILYQVVEYH